MNISKIYIFFYLIINSFLTESYILLNELNIDENWIEILCLDAGHNLNFFTLSTYTAGDVKLSEAELSGRIEEGEIMSFNTNGNGQRKKRSTQGSISLIFSKVENVKVYISTGKKIVNSKNYLYLIFVITHYSWSSV